MRNFCAVNILLKPQHAVKVLCVWLCLITTVPTENVVERQSHMIQIALQVTFLYYCNSIKQPYCWGGGRFRVTLLFDAI